MKILIADDHSVVREGLKLILKDLKITGLIEEVNEGYEALDKITSGNYDFVILDILMPGLSGLDILNALKARNMKVNILILSAYSHGQYAVRALELGASGYISKNSAPEELALAIKKVFSGEKYISSDIIGKLVSNLQKPDNTYSHNRLSEREFQIMCFLVKGTSIIEIGKKLSISEKTVSAHRAHLLEKMGMKSNTELALYAFKNNLIE
jgi:two-component system invasion response regulator UvrY